MAVDQFVQVQLQPNLKFLSLKVENFTKCSSKEPDEDVDSLPFKDLPETIIHIRIKRGSKLRNILGFALKSFKSEDKRQLVCSAIGPAISKAISCVEIIKRKNKNLYQITKIRYFRVDELWEPNKPELDKLKVTREVPSIHILLSKDKLSSEEPGYQPPGKYSLIFLSTIPGNLKDDLKEKPKAPLKKFTRNQFRGSQSNCKIKTNVPKETNKI